MLTYRHSRGSVRGSIGRGKCGTNGRVEEESVVGPRVLLDSLVHVCIMIRGQWAVQYDSESVILTRINDSLGSFSTVLLLDVFDVSFVLSHESGSIEVTDDD